MLGIKRRMHLKGKGAAWIFDRSSLRQSLIKKLREQSILHKCIIVCCCFPYNGFFMGCLLFSALY